MKQSDHKDIRIVFMGTPEFAVGSLSALLDKGYNVVGAVTVPDKPSGRGQKINHSAVKEYLLQNRKDIPVLQPVSLKDPEFLDALAALKADLFAVVAFRMLPKVVWSMPPMGTFNLHASLLPDYRGAAPINWAIINGETRTGVTTFLLDEKIDTGAILFQEEMPIAPEDNLETVYDKLLHLGAGLLLKTVDALCDGTAVPRPQKGEGHGAPKITRETGKIDWSQPAAAINNLIRGLSPCPAAHSTLVQKGKSLEMKIFQAAPSDHSSPEGTFGKVFSDGKSRMTVKCGTGDLEILELQVAGKKRMPVKSFLAGWHNGWENVSFE